MELQQLSDTQWACRGKALKALQRNLKAILNLLDGISTPNEEAKEAVHILCDFYGEDGNQLKTELKVFHSSFPAKDLKEVFAILHCFGGEIIFKAENDQKQTKKSVWRRKAL